MLQTERKVSKVLEAYARRSIELDNAKAEGQSEQVDLFNQRGLRSLRLRSLMRAGSVVLAAPSDGTVEVAMAAPKLKRTEITSFPLRHGQLFLPMDQLRERVCKTFNWKSCTMETQELSTELSVAEDLRMAWNSYLISEASRRRDALESVLESVRAAMSADDLELHFQSCHALWELACDETNHKFMSYTLFSSLQYAQGIYFTGMRDLKESNREPGLIKTGIYTTLVVYTTSVTVGI